MTLICKLRIDIIKSACNVKFLLLEPHPWFSCFDFSPYVIGMYWVLGSRVLLCRGRGDTGVPHPYFSILPTYIFLYHSCVPMTIPMSVYACVFPFPNPYAPMPPPYFYQPYFLCPHALISLRIPLMYPIPMSLPISMSLYIPQFPLPMFQCPCIYNILPLCSNPLLHVPIPPSHYDLHFIPIVPVLLPMFPMTSPYVPMA